MPSLENLKKQAKLLVRWHGEGRLPVAERIRNALESHAQLTDREVLERPFQLAQAQEVIARENGFANWEALKSGIDTMTHASSSSGLKLEVAMPQVFVRDITASSEFYRDKLGFTIVFTFGSPPFYGLMQRDNAVLNLRCIGQPVFVEGVRARNDLLAANIVVSNLKALYLEYQAAGVEFRQPMRKQPWGAEDFSVEDPDGNLLLFASRNDER